MPTFQDARDGLDALLKDGKQNLSPTDKDQHLKLAARTFQGRFPRVLAKEVTGDGGFEYALPTEFVDGFSKIVDVYYPWTTTEQNPEPLESQDYRVWDGPSGVKFRFRDDTPLASEKFLLQFTAPHTVGDAVDVVSALSAAGTAVAGASFSGAANVDKAAEVQVFVHVTGVPGGAAALDVFVQVSEDNSKWSDVGSIAAPVTAVGDYMIPLAKERVAKYLRLRYAPEGGTFTLEAKVVSEESTGTFTVPDHLMDAYLYLAASISAQALADFYAGLLDSQLQGDSTDYEGKATFWQANADAWRTKWEETREEKSPPRGSSSGSQGEWDLVGSTGWEYLTHRRQHR